MARRSPLPKICIALGFTTPEALLSHAVREIESGESLLEFRLDYLPKPLDGIAVIRNVLADNPEVSIIATCRRHQNHGRFNGSIEEQIRILETAVDAGAKAFDLEIESAGEPGVHIENLRSKAFFMLSFHNFNATPSLEAVLRRMEKVGADVYKLVATARKPSDNLRVLSLAKSNPKTPLVMLSMGEVGQPSRVISPAFGGMFTYAAPNAAEGTASGQISARSLRHIYRIDKFTKNAKIYGVIADPVRHSISPQIHNRAFQHKRIDSVYLPFLVQPTQLKDFFLLADKLPISGFSVTIPHKQRIIRYLDYVDPLARRIGAVNTVWRKAGKWRGTNTDVEGILQPLKKKLNLSRSSVLVVGNGGAARGAAFAVAGAGAKVSITGRNPDRVRALAKLCGASPLTREELSKQGFDVVIHCTPIGMFPNNKECFFSGKIPGEIVFDTVYNPLETTLIQRAKQQGKTVIPGLQMFLEQAAHQFEIWTGETAPRAMMEKSALEALESKKPS
jgi:3-dehydroquinate dehydratase/shikimate dehydrogenase